MLVFRLLSFSNRPKSAWEQRVNFQGDWSTLLRNAVDFRVAGFGRKHQFNNGLFIVVAFLRQFPRATLTFAISAFVNGTTLILTSRLYLVAKQHWDIPATKSSTQLSQSRFYHFPVQRTKKYILSSRWVYWNLFVFSFAQVFADSLSVIWFIAYETWIFLVSDVFLCP